MEQEKNLMSTNIASTTSTTGEGIFSNKNSIIIILSALLVFSFLGINLLYVFGNFIQSIVNIFGPLVAQVLSIFGYTTGTVLNKTADIASDVAKTGIDIAEGTLQSVGDLLKNSSSSNVNLTTRNQLDKSLNISGLQYKEPSPDNSINPIQKPITSAKQAWCLVGEYQGKRGCIAVTDSNKCLSGQIFPTQQLCLNPTLTQR
jgi:hypothetical protein